MIAKSSETGGGVTIAQRRFVISDRLECE